MKTLAIQAVIPTDAVEKMKQLIDQVREILPFLVAVTNDEQKRMAKLSRKRKELIDKTMIYSVQRPEFMPQFKGMAEFQGEVTAIEQLQRIYAMLQPLIRQVNDTIMVMQTSAYEKSRVFYKTVKEATKHGVDGADIIFQDISYHFKKSPPAAATNGDQPQSKNQAAQGQPRERQAALMYEPAQVVHGS